MTRAYRSKVSFLCENVMKQVKTSVKHHLFHLAAIVLLIVLIGVIHGCGQ